MDNDKLKQWLSNEENKKMLEELIQGSVQEDPSPPSKKRKRRSKKHNEVQASEPQVLPSALPSSRPVTQRNQNTNLFDKSPLRNEYKNLIPVDKKIKKTVSSRELNRNQHDIACRECNKKFTISTAELKHDGDEYYYVCNRCLSTRKAK